MEKQFLPKKIIPLEKRTTGKCYKNYSLLLKELKKRT